MTQTVSEPKQNPHILNKMIKKGIHTKKRNPICSYLLTNLKPMTQTKQLKVHLIRLNPSLQRGGDHPEIVACWEKIQPGGSTISQRAARSLNYLPMISTVSLKC